MALSRTREGVLPPIDVLPRLTRYSVLALGRADGREIRVPRNPVSAWLVQSEPGLRDDQAAADVLGTIRARTEVIDAELAILLAGAERRNDLVGIWSLGAGLDARWHHLLQRFDHVIASWVEVDEPQVIAFKHRALVKSPYGSMWARVGRTPAASDEWRVVRARGVRPVIVLDGTCGRLSERRFNLLLDRVKDAAFGGWVVVDLPLEPSGVRRRWSSRALASRGWNVTSDRRVESRSWLMGPGGGLVCAGSHPYRVVVLEPT